MTGQKYKTYYELLRSIPRSTINKIAYKLEDSVTGRSDQDPQPRFAMFLGAGASAQSGVKLAGQMMSEFREKIIKENGLSEMTEVDRRKWFEKNVFNRPGTNDYGKFFECFEDAPIGRRDHIKKLLRDAKPSIGYAVLAGLMARNYVNVVLTTNFDDLVFTSCVNFTGVRPVIYAYGILDTELQISSSQPKIVKLHGDFLYSKLANLEEEMKEFGSDPNMAARVNCIFCEYQLIVLGYSGSDRSVMDILKNYPGDKDLYWCYKKGDPPMRPVLDLLSAKKGKLVEIEGFNEAMSEMYEVLGFDFTVSLTNFTKSIEFIFQELHKFDLDFSARVLAKAVEKTAREFDVEQKPAFLNAFRELNEGEIAYMNGEFVEAEKKYRNAIDQNPGYSGHYYCLGRLLDLKLHRYDEAEEYYRKALDIDRNDAYACNRLGLLLAKAGKSEAKEQFEKAIEAKPAKPFFYVNLGNFLFDAGEYQEAEEIFRKAIKIDPYFLEAYEGLNNLFQKTGEEQKKRELRRLVKRNKVRILEDAVSKVREYRKNKDLRRAMEIVELLEARWGLKIVI